MIKNKQTRRTITLFFLLFLFVYKINAQGPNSIEAAAFEPVDATDMVNLLTGDFTYVLPLLSIPSPEGGYPISLSYHAGIGLDQEASWVGLGWNVNPGAITRGVNGYPDDWKSGVLNERFYDVGGEEVTQGLTLSYTSISGYSIATSISHSSSKGFGGSVSMGVGIPLGGDNYLGLGSTIGIRPGGKFFAGGNVGYKGKSGLTAGINLSTDTGLGFSAGYKKLKANYNEAGVGLSLSSNALGVSLSSKGGSIMAGSANSQSFSFNDKIDGGDYTVNTDKEMYGLYIPTPIGMFGIGYNKQRVRWYLNTLKQTRVSGLLYLEDAIKYPCRVKTATNRVSFGNGPSSGSKFETIVYLESPSSCNCSSIKQLYPAFFATNNYYTNTSCIETELLSVDAGNEGSYFMDTYELGVNDEIKTMNKNNLMFPSYDSYRVVAQGISGSLTPKISRGGALMGLSRNYSDSNLYKANYNLTEATGYNGLSFTRGGNASKYFYFDNQYSSSFAVEHAEFKKNTNANSIYDYFKSNKTYVKRKQDGKVVSYFTLKEVRNGYAARQGLLLPYETEYNFQDKKLYIIDGQNLLDENSIAAYMVTTTDGKTYHYSLPVVNFEAKTRIKGIIENKTEAESYFESSQPSYVTHWLLTAVTGPDYNKKEISRYYPNEKDDGYWVRFDYGKWTDNFVWKSPYDKEWNTSEIDLTIKSKTYGKKQLYYLDNIKTRTHTAIFVKNLREDGRCPEWSYNGFSPFLGEIVAEDYSNIWTIPTQKQLRLEKIILVKNEDNKIDKSSGRNLVSEIGELGNDFSGKSYYNDHKNIIDITDNISETEAKAVKIIDFGSHYDYSLANNSINSTSGKLTLKGVSFLGRKGVSVTPPYRFEYGNNKQFDYSKKDLWGFYKDSPEVWSLNKIITPTGGSIMASYESDDYDLAAAETGKIFNNNLEFNLNIYKGNHNGITDIKIKVNDKFKISDYFDVSKPIYMDVWFSVLPEYSVFQSQRANLNIAPQYADIMTINTVDNSMVVRVNVATSSTLNSFKGDLRYQSIPDFKNHKLERPHSLNNNAGYSLLHTIKSNKIPDGKKGGGLRVNKLEINDEGKVYRTKYNYNKPGYDEDVNSNAYKSSGVISYQPIEEGSENSLPYGSELPAPIPMYEYVTVKNNVKDITNEYADKTLYKFNVLKEKDKNKVKFGNLFEISEETFLETHNSLKNKNVSISKYLIKDNLANLGQLIHVKQYNSKNQLIGATNYNYAKPEDITKGIIQESFQTYKTVDYANDQLTDEWLINSSSRISYPSVLKSKSILRNNNEKTIHYDKHDDVSGELLESREYNSKGLSFKRKVIPAYHTTNTIIKSQYGEYVFNTMGPKNETSGAFNLRNKNMLTQMGAEYFYIRKNDKWEPISVKIATWKKNWIYQLDDRKSASTNTIWRNYQNYIWKGALNEDGTYNGFKDDFDWTVDGVQTSDWQKISETTRYNQFSSPLEVKDINNNYASSKKGDNYTKVIATANANYYEMHYSGAEYLASENSVYFDGGITSIGYKKVADAHTGNHIVEISQDQNAFEVNVPRRDDRTGIKQRFKASVWVKKGQEAKVKIKVNNGVPISFNTNENVPAGNWTMLTGYITIPEAGVTVSITSTSGTIQLDDFRLHPATSSMTSYVYNEWDEVSFITGANGLSTHYLYDSAGRLIETQVEVIDNSVTTGGFKKVSTNSYNYKRNNK